MGDLMKKEIEKEIQSWLKTLSFTDGTDLEGITLVERAIRGHKDKGLVDRSAVIDFTKPMKDVKGSLEDVNHEVTAEGWIILWYQKDVEHAQDMNDEAPDIIATEMIKDPGLGDRIIEVGTILPTAVIGDRYELKNVEGDYYYTSGVRFEYKGLWIPPLPDEEEPVPTP